MGLVGLGRLASRGIDRLQHLPTVPPGATGAQGGATIPSQSLDTTRCNVSYVRVFRVLTGPCDISLCGMVPMSEDKQPPNQPQSHNSVITVLRVVWVAVQLALVYCIGEKGALFFYQAF